MEDMLRRKVRDAVQDVRRGDRASQEAGLDGLQHVSGQLSAAGRDYVAQLGAVVERVWQLTAERREDQPVGADLEAALEERTQLLAAVDLLTA